ncbi:hypothetical protein ACFFRR_009473 [Megaselia abdita]
MQNTKKIRILNNQGNIDEGLICINRRFVQRAVHRFLGSGSVKSEKKVGRKQSVRISRNIRKERSAISHNPARSASKLRERERRRIEEVTGRRGILEVSKTEFCSLVYFSM